MRNRKQIGRHSTPAAIYQNAVSKVETIIATNGTKYTSKDLADSFIGLESISDDRFLSVARTQEELVQELRDSDFTNLFPDNISPEKLSLGLEAAAYTLLVGASPAEYFKRAAEGANTFSGTAGVVMTPADGGHSAFGLESFEAGSIQKYLAQTAVANAQAAVLGGFEDVWFPQQLVPAGQNGVDILVTIPQVFTTTTHTETTGAPYTIIKQSLISAVIDPSILESNATTIVPWAQGTDSTSDPHLVPAAQVPTTTATVGGLTVNTRPIVFGSKTSLIGISNATNLLNVGIFDETDALDPIINIGTVYYKLTVTTGANTQSPVTNYVYLATDVSNQAGTLLTQVQAGRIQALQTTATVSLPINHSIVPVNGSAAPLITALEGILGIGAGVAFTIVATVDLSATADTEYGNMTVNANSPVIAKLYDATNTAAPLTPFSATGVSVTITPLGFTPLARRTNSNLRQNGTIIDSNTTITYRYPVNLQAPIISQSPIGGATNTTLEGLGHASRIRQNGRAVTALANAESSLATYSGISGSSPFVGSLFVTPTYVAHGVDVSTLVTTMNSQENLINLRGALVSAITNTVNELLIKSGYPAALELTNGDPDAFEIIVATDQEIAPHIWESGDIRTFGDARNYKITKSNNKFFKGKVYISFRRTTRSDEIHPLDFGRMLVTPPLTYDVAINRNGRTTNEIHTIPRVNAYVTLPILGVLSITNLESIYISS